MNVRFEYRMRKARLREDIPRWIANHLPASVVYFATIRAWAHATSGEYGHEIATEIHADEVVRRWGKDKSVG